MVSLIAGLAVAAVLQNPAAQTGRIAGVVVEEGTNLPVAGARVLYGPAEQPASPRDPAPETTTNEDGRFSFEQVPPGRYRVVALNDDFAPPLEHSIFPFVELAAGQEIDNISIALSHGGTLAGRVLDASGSPLASAHVTALLKRLDTLTGGDAPLPNGKPYLLPFGQRNTSERGEFTIERLPSGDYLVAASKVGTTFYPNTTDESAAQTVSVRNGRTTSDITIRMAAVRTFRVSGTVVDADGTPLPDLAVNLLSDVRSDVLLPLFVGTHGAIVTNVDGAFAFDDIPTGSYIVSAGGGGGVDGFSTAFVIDGSGAVTTEADGKKPPLSPGSIGVTVTDADVTGLKIIRPRPRE